MNRTIKFRAWDILNKKWIVSYYNHNYFISIDKSKLICVEHDDINIEGVVYDKDFNVIITQFTGLYDCEGKEIYENDIVLLAHWKSTDLFDYSKPFVVNWEYGQVNFKQGEYNNFIGSLVGQLTIKVIGNIFEHPNLLNNES